MKPNVNILRAGKLLGCQKHKHMPLKDGGHLLCDQITLTTLTHYISVHFMPIFPLNSEILKDNGCV